MMNARKLMIPMAFASVGMMQAKEEATRPNVIVIIADDLGFGDVSAYGAKTIHTPNMDKLAKGGIAFTNGYATSATSTPSRYAMFTGMYPWKNQAAQILPGDAPLLISPKVPTLPKMMQKEGYKTAAIGKWHLGMGNGNVDWNKQISPCANDIGFDYSCLIAATNDRVPTVYVRDGLVVGLEKDDPIEVNYEKNYPGQPTAVTNPELMKMPYHHGHNCTVVNGVPRIGYMKGGKNAHWVDEDMADFFVGEVKEFIDQQEEEPFFLYYGLHQPHVPRTPHSRFLGTSGMGPRGDAIIEADWCVGELIDYLEEKDMLENTLILFSSDNGPVLNDGYYDGAVEQLGFHDPAGGLRGGKYSLFDAGTHVPFFAYWPGTIAPRTSDALFCQLDFYATLAELIGGELPKGLDSENLLPVLLENSDNGRDHLIVEAQGKLAIRKGDYAMIPPYKGDIRNMTGNEIGNMDRFTLYDLKTDPGQRKNIADERPQMLEQIKTLFLETVGSVYNAELKDRPLK